MTQYKSQYNNRGYNQSYKKNYNNNYQSSTNKKGLGFATFTTSKSKGTVLKVEIYGQDLVMQGFWNGKGGFSLYPFYDKTKSNPNFNKPKQSYQQENDMDDQLPQSEKEWSKGEATEFNPTEYEHQLGD